MRVAALLLVIMTMSLMDAPGADAQDRMPPLSADALTDAQRAAVADFKAARGADLTGPFHAMLRSPEVLNRARAIGDYLRFKSALPPRLSEFVILLTARQWTQHYEWNLHYPIALRAGLLPDVGVAIAEGRRPPRMSDDEETLYDFCTELQRTHAVSDATYARALARFGEQGVIDTTAIVGYYSLLAMTLNVARTPAPAAAGVPALPPLPR